MSRTHLDRQRAQYRQAFVEKIEVEEHLAQVLDNVKFLQDSAKDEEGAISSNQLGAIKAANEAHLKLIGLKIPSPKAVEASITQFISQEDAVDELE